MYLSPLPPPHPRRRSFHRKAQGIQTDSMRELSLKPAGTNQTVLSPGPPCLFPAPSGCSLWAQGLLGGILWLPQSLALSHHPK